MKKGRLALCPRGALPFRRAISVCSAAFRFPAFAYLAFVPLTGPRGRVCRAFSRMKRRNSVSKAPLSYFLPVFPFLGGGAAANSLKTASHLSMMATFMSPASFLAMTGSLLRLSLATLSPSA